MSKVRIIPDNTINSTFLVFSAFMKRNNNNIFKKIVKLSGAMHESNIPVGENIRRIEAIKAGLIFTISFTIININPADTILRNN